MAMGCLYLIVYIIWCVLFFLWLVLGCCILGGGFVSFLYVDFVGGVLVGFEGLFVMLVV